MYLAKGETLEASLTKLLSNTSHEKLDKILIPLSRLVRHSINKDLAEAVNGIQDDVERLSQGSENVIDLLCCQPYSNAQLAVLFEQYKLKYYQDIRETVDIDFHDTAQQCLKTIGEVFICIPYLYFIYLFVCLFDYLFNMDKHVHREGRIYSKVSIEILNDFIYSLNCFFTVAHQWHI